MRGSRTFCQRGLNCDVFFFVFFLVDGGGRIQVPLLADHICPSIMAFRWRPYDGPTLNSSLVALQYFRDLDLYCYKPYMFVIFTGVPGPL